ncbi:MAG: response regulator [Elusimicrobiota bacterium]
MPKKILVVDDNPTMIVMLESLLLNKGYEVITEQTGESAIESACTLLPDLVILDVALPDIDGWEVSRRLKADAITSRIPILVLTGKMTANEHEVESFEAGADDYVLKPFDTDVLLARIASCIKRGDKK